MLYLVFVLNANAPAFRDTLAYDLIIALLVGVVSGIIASGLFFLVLRIFKPRIRIAKEIVKQIINKENGEIEIHYWFKFINMTKADIENISIDLFLMEDYFNGSAKNYETKRLKIARSEIKFLVGLNKRSKDTFNNCVQMKILEPLEEKWNGKKEWMQLHIDSKHSQSGRRKVQVMKFQDPERTIVVGKFDSGENFKILN